MPSPFPGMDPYLEGYLWPDVYHRLATQISDQLTPHLRPRYDQAAYDLSIDYSPPPPPPEFSTDELAWLDR